MENHLYFFDVDILEGKKTQGSLRTSSGLSR